jgi:hypothetical protein
MDTISYIKKHVTKISDGKLIKKEYAVFHVFDTEVYKQGQF